MEEYFVRCKKVYPRFIKLKCIKKAESLRLLETWMVDKKYNKNHDKWYNFIINFIELEINVFFQQISNFDNKLYT